MKDTENYKVEQTMHKFAKLDTLDLDSMSMKSHLCLITKTINLFVLHWV